MKLDKADQEFAKYIKNRDNWQCQRCFKQYSPGDRGLHCSHFYGRRKENTRHEPDNCVALCYGCHKYFDETDREAYRDFKLVELGGKRFDTLKVQANTHKKKDRKLEYIKYKKLNERTK